MKKFIFVSDFDGTIIDIDFYRYIMQKYLPHKEESSYRDWRAGKMLDIEFLGEIFTEMNLEEEVLHQEILSLPFDPHFAAFASYIQEQGGDMVILSAGTSYYIDILLQHYGFKNITVYSNKGVYHKKGIHFNLDPKEPYYSERYGIDKQKVVQSLRKEYSTIYYAGDSSPDVAPAKISDIVFAKNELIELLQNEGIPFVPFQHFDEVQTYLENHLHS